MPSPQNDLSAPVFAPMTFDYLFRKYYRTMVHFAHKFLRDNDKSKDVVTDTFIKLSQTACHFDDRKSKAFLYISIRNACINVLKHDAIVSRKHKQFVYWDDEIQASPLKEIVRAECMRLVMDIVEQLPPQCRKIMLMKFVEGLRNREIAGIMNLSIKTVINQVQRGQSLVKKRIGSLSEIEGVL
jgi:RNA polymerase sigma-70 factor (family 1)